MPTEVDVSGRIPPMRVVGEERKREHIRVVGGFGGVDQAGRGGPRLLTATGERQCVDQVGMDPSRGYRAWFSFPRQRPQSAIVSMGGTQLRGVRFWIIIHHPIVRARPPR